MTVTNYFYNGRRLFGVVCGYIPKINETIKVKKKNWKEHKMLKVNEIKYSLEENNDYIDYQIEVYLV